MYHYIDVIMATVASQIISLTVVYSTVYSDTDQRKHQSSASLAFVWGIHRDRWIPRTRGQLRGNFSIWWRHHDPRANHVNDTVEANKTPPIITLYGIEYSDGENKLWTHKRHPYRWSFSNVVCSHKTKWGTHNQFEDQTTRRMMRKYRLWYNVAL